jgi:hypothetical protein
MIAWGLQPAESVGWMIRKKGGAPHVCAGHSLFDKLERNGIVMDDEQIDNPADEIDATPPEEGEVTATPDVSVDSYVAKIAELEGKISELSVALEGKDAEISAAKAHNYDLMVNAPGVADPIEAVVLDNPDDEIADFDDFFGTEDKEN